MKTHLYQYQQLEGKADMKTLLVALDKTKLIDRNRNINGHENRIESIEFGAHDGADCAMVNFVKLRMDHGPGRAGRGERTKGFDLSKNEAFAEETAVLFDFSYNHLLSEYNHHGARVTALQDYLNRIIPDLSHRHEILPRLDEDVMRKLSKLKTISKFEVKIAPKKLTPADKRSALSVMGALDAAEIFDAPSITITLGGLPGNPAKLSEKIMGVIGKFVKIVEKEDSLSEDSERGIKTLKVAGRERPKDSPELLDLIKGRIFNEHDLTAGPDRRFSWDDRIEALKRDHFRWRKIIR